MGENLASLFVSGLFSIFLVFFLEPKKGRKALFLGIILSSGLLFLNIFISDLYSLYNVYSLMMDLAITVFFWWFFLKGTINDFLLGFALYYFGLYFSSCFAALILSFYGLEIILGFQSIDTAYKTGFLTLTKILLLLYVVVILHFRIKIRHYKQGVLAVRTAEKENEVEKLHYMLYVQRESLKKFIEQERDLYRLRHELEHKLFSVQYLFEKNQKEEGVRVLKQIIMELCGDAKSISVSQNIVETVITNIEKKYEKEAIQIEKEIHFPDETIMELVDLCVLLGNLLENAMEAAAGSSEKQVRISVREEFNCLYLKISNTFSEKNSDVKTFVSKKEAVRHGFGMRNIREIVKRYGGELLIYDEIGWFYMTVIIYGQK